MTITAEHAVKILNDALEADPAAINELFRHRASCNEALAEHSSIQVRAYAKEREHAAPPTVGFLGLLNGIFGMKPSGYGHLQSEVENGQIVRFSIHTG